MTPSEKIAEIKEVLAATTLEGGGPGSSTYYLRMVYFQAVVDEIRKIVNS